MKIPSIFASIGPPDGEERTKVFARCESRWIDLRTVKVLSISEDLESVGILIFRCPLCDNIHNSIRKV